MRDSKIVSFDPYEILGIDRGATDKQIKKGYKLKALEFHPDKNIGDEGAAHNFMLVAKAYGEALGGRARRGFLCVPPMRSAASRPCACPFVVILLLIGRWTSPHTVASKKGGDSVKSTGFGGSGGATPCPFTWP